MKGFKTADQFFAGTKEWKAELTELREILLSTGLEETVKWGSAVYTFDGKNVVGVGGFKSYFGLWFFQGALLADKKKLLINAQAGRTKALRPKPERVGHMSNGPETLTVHGAVSWYLPKAAVL